MTSDRSTSISRSAQGARRKFLQTRALPFVAAAMGSLGAGSLWPQPARGAARSRPIADFLGTQGTFCFDDGAGGCTLFVPPAPNFLGWNAAIVDLQHVTFAGVDYAGLANAALGNVFGTRLNGTVTERPLADGRAEVQVLLFADRANTWVIDLDLTGDVLAQIAGKPTLFGKRPGTAGAAALGSCVLQARFTNTAMGAPLPDLLQLQNAPAAGQSFNFIGFNTEARGPLTTEFGVVNGTPGRCTIRQTGLFAVAQNVPPNRPVVRDAFPAELIELRQVGR